MDRNIFDYHFVQEAKQKGKLKDLIQFGFAVDDINSKKQIPYLFNFYAFKSYLYITDYFPAMWENHPDRVNKLLSQETGFKVNFKKITLTCFYIFHEEIVSKNKDAAFIANGSLIAGEEYLADVNISRKLMLYWKILTPHIEAHDYRTVDLFKHNAFAIVKKTHPMTDEEIIRDYDNFKKH